MECALEDLNPLFTCPLCQGYLRQPHTVKCCRTSYCRDCLVRILLQRGSQCANCKEYMGAKLSDKARPDLQLESIMGKLLPQVFAEEKAREEAFYQAREAGYPMATSPSGAPPPPPQGLAPPASTGSRQSNKRPTSGRGSSSSSSSSSSHGNGSSSNRHTVLHEDMFVCCVPAQPHAEEEGALPALQLPYLKVQRRTQVGHLKRLVVAGLGSPRGEGPTPEQLDLVCKGQVLTAQHSLHFIEQTMWRPKKQETFEPLTLQYRLREATGTPTPPT